MIISAAEIRMKNWEVSDETLCIPIAESQVIIKLSFTDKCVCVKITITSACYTTYVICYKLPSKGRTSPGFDRKALTNDGRRRHLTTEHLIKQINLNFCCSWCIFRLDFNNGNYSHVMVTAGTSHFA